jgi:hypothetical protein
LRDTALTLFATVVLVAIDTLRLHILLVRERFAILRSELTVVLCTHAGLFLIDAGFLFL